ncbi:MAG: Hsp33 family molecular chaperone HslO [Gammaproteobacteria bacterium]|nr:Hsp33 family molecular chaperone HslO [Gammaproteobacteria bacterium]NNF50315.1 Hsp33 family molecular chaperone HslO [Woeseiaceae bacterium]MBT8094736.1 Hsp33 family molecular chaperone HslO [Gammaproteobacteria bacterium]MBT8105562.1 Hsp33 family molecular chaperone HslO [Gammaproteobacteria bacterium]NNK25576.1 Hsp33 family molecular chaperone HslO [Woeseiaceae bacterium]
MSADSVIPFAFESLPVRGALIHMKRSWRRMQRDHAYSPLLAETLGHAAAATGLIAQSLKFDGAITLQIQGSGALQMLVVQCTSRHQMRGMAAMENRAAAQDFVELTRDAHCAITVDAGERPYQGIVAIDGDSLAASLEHYFERSVQVPSHLALVASEEVAGGILLQQMPGQPIDADDWDRLGYLAATLSQKDFSGEAGIELLAKLFNEDDVRVYSRKPVTFRCRCSARKVAEVLRMLGEHESRAALAEQGDIEIVCEYCGRRRHFDAVDVERIFTAGSIEAPDSLH